MSRRIDEDTIRQLLLDENSDEENGSGSEKEDHLLADPAYETDDEENTVSVTEQPPSSEDIQTSTCSLASCSRKTRRWPLCNFYGMLNIAFINSNVINVTNTLAANKNPLSRREFLKALHQKLVEPHIQKRLLIPTLQTGLRDSITAILNMPGTSSSTSTHETDQREDAVTLPIAKKRKKCAICPPSRRRMTKVCCAKCNKSLCGEHKLEICHKCIN